MTPLLLFYGVFCASWHQVYPEATTDREQLSTHFDPAHDSPESLGGEQNTGDGALLQEHGSGPGSGWQNDDWSAAKDSLDVRRAQRLLSNLRENFHVDDNYIENLPSDLRGDLTASLKGSRFWTTGNDDSQVVREVKKARQEEEGELNSLSQNEDYLESNNDLNSNELWRNSPDDVDARSPLEQRDRNSPDQYDARQQENRPPKKDISRTQHERWTEDTRDEHMKRKRKRQQKMKLKETLQEARNDRQQQKQIVNNEGQSSPHIVFILADDLGYNDVPWHNPDIQAPELLKLARTGVLLENHYVLPLCAPSRAALLTGLYPFRYGKQASARPLSPTGLNASITLLPQRLKTFGYRTHLVGKWHLGYCSWAYTPTNRGFDSFYGYYLGSQTYFSRFKKLSPKKGSPFWYDQNEVVNDDDDLHRRPPDTSHHELKLQHQLTEEAAKHATTKGGAGQDWLTPEHMADGGYDFRFNHQPITNVSEIYSNDLYATRAEQVIQDHASRTPGDPLFLLLSLQAVHGPVEVPLKYRRMHRSEMNLDRRTFHGMVSAMDEVVGRVVAQLKASGLYHNSVIVFTSDNGGNVRAGGNNFPLRGSKGSLFEGGTRGVAFIHSPLLPRTGYKFTGLMHMVDWPKTLIHLASGKHLVARQTPRLEQHLPRPSWPGGLFSDGGEEESEDDDDDEEAEEEDDGDGDGMNLWPAILKNRKSPRTSFVYNLRKQPMRGAIRHKNWKLVVGGGGRFDGWVPPSDVAGGAISSCCSSWHSKTPISNVMLYNLKDDPLETTDVSDLRPDVAANLKARLRAYVLESREPHSPRDDPRGHPRLHGGFFSPGWCQPLV
nr:arylsulfatase I-like [Procambarus clarkii]XP_045584706.1 arylsulfatase I-like [Procambarus clarkii]XP_045584707.1 arylsulfatase I-like [Procambarus clarkii]XP_045584708.1 arylsulfatase I-like [Procambarus clarkii]XP_045584709.1 arylsulfatase I-like [Procambarus clarkii]XP_045584710.1 arylsulfatase I-like [Procambarus clarkii]